nr:hypothetical protein CFP56_30191 [Quercus suber]
MIGNTGSSKPDSKRQVRQSRFHRITIDWRRVTQDLGRRIACSAAFSRSHCTRRLISSSTLRSSLSASFRYVYLVSTRSPECSQREGSCRKGRLSSGTEALSDSSVTAQPRCRRFSYQPRCQL